VWSALTVLLVAAVLCAAAAFWALRAYRRAGGSARVPAIAACAIAAIAGLGVYLAIGRPELADAPYAARIEALKQRDPRTYTVDEALAMWAEIARAYPRLAEPHIRTGSILLRQGRVAEAARAFDSALRREPQSPEALLGMGRAMVQLEGAVSPQALALFQQAGQLSDDPVPWIYQAWAAMEAGQNDEAQRLWREALTRMAPDDPRRQMAEQMASGRGDQAQ
jgi:cytochrome c-type biogenesis protein CcmH